MAESVNLFIITEFFKGEANRVKKGLNSCESGRVCSITLSEDGVILGKVGASMKKKVYDVRVRKIKLTLCRILQICKQPLRISGEVREFDMVWKVVTPDGILSVCDVDGSGSHIGWKSGKLIARTMQLAQHLRCS